jgi:hemerythrin-like domain-containing protein
VLPITPLMTEHRLIERMISALGKEVDRMEREKSVHGEVVDGAVDFIRTYADRCHHGKEEDILFRESKKKNLSKGHREVLESLLGDHQSGRKAVRELIEAKERYMRGDIEAFSVIVRNMKFLLLFYPRHIEREEMDFFEPSMGYFNEEEKEAMVKEEREFDRNLIHRIYEERVLNAENGNDVRPLL